MDEPGRKFPVFFLFFKVLYILGIQRGLIKSLDWFHAPWPKSFNNPASINLTLWFFLYIFIIFVGPWKFQAQTRKILIYIDIGTILILFLVNLIGIMFVENLSGEYVLSYVGLTVIGCIGLCGSLIRVCRNRTPFWDSIL
jgi:hypothetical protein